MNLTNKFPLVFIIIPVHNRQEKIKRSIASILSQSYTHWKLLVVDDSSTDSTREVVQSFIEHDDRISLKTNGEYPRGPAGARNSGLDDISQQAEFVAFLDSDDEWFQDHLNSAVRVFDNSPNLDCVVADLTRLTEVGKVLISSKFKDEKGILDKSDLVEQNNFLQVKYSTDTLEKAIKKRFTIGLHSAVFRKKIFKNRRLANTRVAEDHILTLELLKNQTAIAFLDSLGLKYYVHENNISSANGQTDLFKQYRNTLCEIRLLKNFISSKALSEQEIQSVKQRICILYFWYVANHQLQGMKKIDKVLKVYVLSRKYGSLDSKMKLTIFKGQIKALLYRLTGSKF